MTWRYSIHNEQQQQRQSHGTTKCWTLISKITPPKKQKRIIFLCYPVYCDCRISRLSTLKMLMDPVASFNSPPQFNLKYITHMLECARCCVYIATKKLKYSWPQNNNQIETWFFFLSLWPKWMTRDLIFKRKILWIILNFVLFLKK